MPAGTNDAATLLAALRDACSASVSSQNSTADPASCTASAGGVPGLFGRLRGPWSLAFWAAKSQVHSLVLLACFDDRQPMLAFSYSS